MIYKKPKNFLPHPYWPEQLREWASGISEFSCPCLLAGTVQLRSQLLEHAAALEEVERLNASWTALDSALRERDKQLIATIAERDALAADKLSDKAAYEKVRDERDALKPALNWLWKHNPALCEKAGVPTAYREFKGE